jgi:hypothetical protein
MENASFVLILVDWLCFNLFLSIEVGFQTINKNIITDPFRVKIVICKELKNH